MLAIEMRTGFLNPFGFTLGVSMRRSYRITDKSVFRFERSDINSAQRERKQQEENNWIFIECPTPRCFPNIWIELMIDRCSCLWLCFLGIIAEGLTKESVAGLPASTWKSDSKDLSGNVSSACLAFMRV